MLEAILPTYLMDLQKQQPVSWAKVITVCVILAIVCYGAFLIIKKNPATLDTPVDPIQKCAIWSGQRDVDCMIWVKKNEVLALDKIVKQKEALSISGCAALISDYSGSYNELQIVKNNLNEMFAVNRNMLSGVESNFSESLVKLDKNLLRASWLNLTGKND